MPQASSPRSARARDARQFIEHPGDLGRGEIWVEEEAGSLANQILGAFSLEARALVGGSPVLPDDRPVDGLAGRAVPQRRLSRAGW